MYKVFGRGSKYEVTLTAVVALCTALLLFLHQFSGALCLLPALLLSDVICIICLPRKSERSTASFFLKIILFGQGIGTWWLWFAPSNILLLKQIPGPARIHVDKVKESHDSFLKHVKPLSQQLRTESIESRALPYSQLFSAELVMNTPTYVSVDLITSTFGPLPPISYSDLKYRPADEIRSKYAKIFQDLPPNGFLSEYKNPCWVKTGEPVGKIPEGRLPAVMACLPYAYILGMPKCGTSDLYERISEHPLIETPRRKEVRWFTRGEFATFKLAREGNFPTIYKDDLVEYDKLRSNDQAYRSERMLGSRSSIYSFTAAFVEATRAIALRPPQDGVIAIDGGPHTLWWPTQSPDGTELPEDVPPSQLLREIQPLARFIITLSDPVRRMYSDYYFLGDDLRPVAMPHPPQNKQHEKSAEEFDTRVLSQIEKFKECVNENRAILNRDIRMAGTEALAYLTNEGEYDAIWFRSSQICAHDRHRFAVGGWGRLAIGLYVLYLEKWLEHFPMEQFLILRLEDYKVDPKEYMNSVFRFLELPSDAAVDWAKVLTDKHFNANKNMHREPIMESTEAALREFYSPYNELLARLLNGEGFKWNVKPGSLRAEQLKAFEKNGQDQNPDIARRDQERREQAKRESDSKLRRGNRDVSSENDHLDLQPRSFSIEGLEPVKDKFGSLIADLDIIPLESSYKSTYDEAAKQLCIAAFSLDTAALKHLLYDVGVSPNLLYEKDFKRNGLQCLALQQIMVEAHPKSQVFAMLRGVDTFLTPLMKPSLNLKVPSVHTRSILNSLSGSIRETARWLLRANIDVMNVDVGGNSFLHHAALGGLESLVDEVLEGNEISLTREQRAWLVNIADREKRTALHYAAANGHTKLLALLVKHGGDLDTRDAYGVSPRDIVMTPGPILPEDALQYLSIAQRPVKRISGRKEMHLARDNGGWGPERLAGYEDEYTCDVDQYYAHELTGQKIFTEYVARNAPVLIRGLLDDWPAKELYKKDKLNEVFGNLNVDVSDIPYANKFGGAGKVAMSLGEYIHETSEHHIVGGEHPWYVFRGHPIPQLSEGNQSTVPYSACPTPQIIYDTFKTFSPKAATLPGIEDPHSRELFVNAQWALGGEGTGAPVHFHNTAWAALVYGAKKWVLYPPGEAIMSNMQIKQYFEEDLDKMKALGVRSKGCIQLAGDVVIVPESWGHGVLNIEESVAVASEVRASLWRIRPGTNLIQILPFDNQKVSRRQH